MTAARGGCGTRGRGIWRGAVARGLGRARGLAAGASTAAAASTAGGGALAAEGGDDFGRRRGGAAASTVGEAGHSLVAAIGATSSTGVGGIDNARGCAYRCSGSAATDDAICADTDESSFDAAVGGSSYSSARGSIWSADGADASSRRPFVASAESGASTGLTPVRRCGAATKPNGVLFARDAFADCARALSERSAPGGGRAGPSGSEGVLRDGE